MKKLILLSIVAMAAIFTSCNKMEATTGGTFYTFILTSMDMEYADKNKQSWKFEWGNFGSKYPSLDNHFTTMPYLVVQKMSGLPEGEPTQINYQHTEKSIIIETDANGGTLDSLRYNDKHMAAIAFDENGQISYYIDYGSDGFRRSVNEIQLNNTETVYTKAYADGKTIATYEYTNFINTGGLQQFGIYGSKYYWPTHLFGMQSAYLLKKMIRLEDGENATYDYNYEFDGYGFVKTEYIARNGVDFMKIKYDYSVAIITVKPA